MPPAQVTLPEAFVDVRDRMMAITKIGLPELAIVLAYDAGERVTTPYAEIVVPSAQFPAMTGGQQEILFSFELRFWCGKAAEGSDGQLQEKIVFNWFPRLCEVFTKYGRLTYPDKNTYPYWLNPLNTKMQRAQIIVDAKWLMVFYWQVALKTPFICM